MKHQITIEKLKLPLWYKGTIGKYHFEANVYDEPSAFGINEGRISKLIVWDEDKLQRTGNLFGSCLMNYDRDWDIQPREKNVAMIDALIDELERLPSERANW